MTKTLKKKYRLYRLCGINFLTLAILLIVLPSFYVIGALISVSYLIDIFISFIVAFEGAYVYILYYYAFSVFSKNYKTLCVMPYKKKECFNAFLNMIDTVVVIKLIFTLRGLVMEMPNTFLDGFLYDHTVNEICFQQLSCVFLTIAFICGDRIFFYMAAKRSFDNINDRSDKIQISNLKYLAYYAFMCFMWNFIAHSVPYSPIYMIVMILIAAFCFVASIILKDRILDAV